VAAAEEQLRRRLELAVGEAEELLGEPAVEGKPSAEVLSNLTARLLERLREAGEDGEAEAEQRAHEEQLARLVERFERRGEELSRVGDAIAQLREVTSPPAMLEVAPRRLGEASELDRVLLSTVQGGTMTAAAAWVRDDPAAAEGLLDELAELPVRLEHPLVEAEVLRRRRATVVTDAGLNPRVNPELTRVMGWDSYVVAPVTIRTRVVAVLHADRRSGPLDVVHSDVLWRFAVGMAQAYESASLRRTLRSERETMRRFLDRLDARLAELSDQAIRLAPSRASSGAPATPPREAAAGERAEDGEAFAGVLTRRELEVLRLLAEGLSNRAIADRLVVSEGTVKFHVNSILRKLRASNRAEAVSRYLTLSGRQGHG
jgi:DNA-binding CsgD family transcriptional regulator